MKRNKTWFITLMAVMLTGSLYGCSVGGGSSSSVEPTSQATSTPSFEPSSDPSSSTFEPSSSSDSFSSQVSSSVEEDTSEELLLNANFNELNAWAILAENGCSVSTVEHGNGQLVLQLNNAKANQTYTVQCKQDGIIVKQGYRYDVSFSIKSSVTREVNFIVQASDYSHYLLNRNISLVAGQEYRFEETFVSSSSTTCLFGFMLGKINGMTSGEHQITIRHPSFKGVKVEQHASLGLDGTMDAAPTSSHGRTLYWSDEFNGNAVDTTKWNFEIGNGNWGWGNNEQEYYTSSSDNAYVSNGSLKITARKERYGNFNYTSARMITKGKFQFHYGYIEARLAVPSMTGIWPAFWMLGANIDQVSWPQCGEIDNMEAVNFNDDVYSTLHWNENGHRESGSGAYNINDRTKYQIYGLEWTESAFIFYVDDVEMYRFAISSSNGTSAFQKDFFFLFNVAVGGNWPGFTIGDVFPQTMSVDYLRVYR